MHTRLARRVRQLVPIQGRVLDFGCGPGLLSQQFIEDAVVVGVDIDQGAIDQYNTSAYNQGIPRDEMQAFHVSHLPELGTFDVIVLCLVLHHMDNELIASTLPQLRSVLRPSGSLVIVENEHSFSGEQIQQLLHTAGFTITHVKTADKIRMHGSTSRLVLASAS